MYGEAQAPFQDARGKIAEIDLSAMNITIEELRESLGTTAGQFADAVGTTILPNDDVGDAVNALAHFAWTQSVCQHLSLYVARIAVLEGSGWIQTKCIVTTHMSPASVGHDVLLASLPLFRFSC